MYYRWEVPDKPLTVYLNLDLIDRLEPEVIRQFKSVSSPGSEIGGVLLGRVVSGSRRAVCVEAAESVECGYSRGPLYLLSTADEERMEEAVTRVRPETRQVVGFFRSNTRNKLVFSEEDLRLARTCFSDPDQVFLLVRPFAMKSSSAGLFVLDQGRIRYRTFPFHRAELVKIFADCLAEPPEATPAPAAPEPEQAPAEPVESAPMPAPPAEPEPVAATPVAETPRQLRLVLTEQFEFGFNRSVLGPEEQARVEQLARSLAGTESRDIEVEGFADEIGAVDYNLELGRQRAQAVAGQLESAERRVRAMALDYSKAAMPAKTRELRKLRRRAVVRVFAAE